MIQSIMRHDNPIKYTPISDQLRELAIVNQIDLRDQSACERLIEDLQQLKSDAPSVHISFPVEPSREALDKLIDWLRAEIDQTIVISVGLQPSIAVGVVVRTPNHQFDFSLRKHLENSREKLKEAIASV
jgi:F0F1-type ATP synthase delta subunit